MKFCQSEKVGTLNNNLCILDETYLFTAGRKVTQDGLEYWKWHGTLYHVAFTKWFPGR